MSIELKMIWTYIYFINDIRKKEQLSTCDVLEMDLNGIIIFDHNNNPFEYCCHPFDRIEKRIYTHGMDLRHNFSYIWICFFHFDDNKISSGVKNAHIIGFILCNWILFLFILYFFVSSFIMYNFFYLYITLI